MSPALPRRTVLAALLAAALPGAARAEPRVEVWKSPSCGCCGGWIDHMRKAGFAVSVHDVEDVTPIKLRHGVGDALASCHTALVDGYVIEGHVPASDVRRLLAERPALRGLTVPGMPASAPGMDMPGEPYDVLAFDAGGAARVWAKH